MKNLICASIVSLFVMGAAQLIADGLESPQPLNPQTPYGWWAPPERPNMGSHGMVSASVSPKPSDKANSPTGRPAMGGHPSGSPAGHSPTMGGHPGGSPDGHSPAMGGHPGGSPAGHSTAMGGHPGGSPAGHSPAMSGHPGGSPAGNSPAMGGHPGGSPTGTKPASNGEPKKANNSSTADNIVRHSFTMNRSPIHKIYLSVQGAEQPTEAPEVYYLTTARTLARHGGVPLGKTTHKAEVVMDEKRGVWRADIVGNSFATVEVFSRFKLNGTTVYSQYNFLHFLTDEDAKDLPKVPETPLPVDWPKLVFPEGSYNGMPFRGLQTGNSVDFSVANVAKLDEPTGGILIDAKPNGVEPSPITFNPKKEKYSFSPNSDPNLVVVSGPMGGSSRNKVAVAVLPLKNSNEVMTFSLTVSLSRWSYRKIGWGLGLVAMTGLTTTVIVTKKRKKFKFNKFNDQDKDEV